MRRQVATPQQGGQLTAQANEHKPEDTDRERRPVQTHPGNQREERDDQGIGERREGRPGPDTVGLVRVLGGAPLVLNRDGDEKQPDEATGDAGDGGDGGKEHVPGGGRHADARGWRASR